MRSKMQRMLAVTAVCAIAVACGGGDGDGDAPPIAAPTPPPAPPAPGGPAPAPTPAQAPTLDRSVVLQNLQNPWDIAFAPDGTMFFTERARGLSVRLANGTVRRLFGTSGSVLVAPDFLSEGQSGANGVAVDPDFANNRFVYVYLATNNGGTKDNRVVRLTVASDFMSVASRTDIVTGISYKDVNLAGDPAGLGAHNGGRIRFGPDGFLYITTGDNHRGLVPQSRSALGGKVLRVTRDGQPAPNNDATGFDARVYAYGLRNPQGIAFRPGTGQPYTSEHGPDHSDEITPLVAGGNGGWDPVCLNNVNYCGYTSNQPNNAPTPMTDLGKFPNAMRPAWVVADSQGMSGNAFLTGSMWKAWDGRLAVGLMAGTRVDLLTLDASGTVVASTPMPSLETGVRIRGLTLAPDGTLYVATDGRNGGDQIWRITPL